MEQNFDRNFLFARDPHKVGVFPHFTPVSEERSAFKHAAFKKKFKIMEMSILNITLFCHSFGSVRFRLTNIIYYNI